MLQPMLRRAIVLALALLAFSISGAAQDFRATLTGRVTDASGAAVPGAKITVKNLNTNETFDTTSTGEGAYTIPFLVPGRYSATVEAIGFKRVANDGFEYWFPRQSPELPLRDGGDSSKELEESGGQGQLVILGGGREATQDRGYEFYQVDDSVVNPEVGAVLRRFLPAVFPGKFEEDGNVEMEWVCRVLSLLFRLVHLLS